MVLTIEIVGRTLIPVNSIAWLDGWRGMLFSDRTSDRLISNLFSRTFHSMPSPPVRVMSSGSSMNAML